MRQHPQADWHPSATLDTLRLRATLLARIRAWFASHGVMEVETPYLSASATTDPAVHSLSTTWHAAGGAPGVDCYLHTSPEFPMKRLLAAGSGDIYQLCRVFRDRERGRAAPEDPNVTPLTHHFIPMKHAYGPQVDLDKTWT